MKLPLWNLIILLFPKYFGAESPHSIGIGAARFPWFHGHTSELQGCVSVWICAYYTGWWFQTFFLLSIIYGVSSFPLTNTFQDGWNHQPVHDIHIYIYGLIIHNGLIMVEQWLNNGNGDETMGSMISLGQFHHRALWTPPKKSWLDDFRGNHRQPNISG